MIEPSRQELVNWVNSTLQLSITKVDECGKGYVYCQLLDSIYNDVAVSRVKFDARSEYEYLNNFKILQASFTAHGIDRPVPVERLVKCRLQDNLEFLQWFKRYWDANFPGHPYDAAARRGSKVSRAPSANAVHPPAPSSRTTTPVQSSRSLNSSARVKPSITSTNNASAVSRPRIAGKPTTTTSVSTATGIKNVPKVPTTSRTTPISKSAGPISRGQMRSAQSTTAVTADTPPTTASRSRINRPPANTNTNIQDSNSNANNAASSALIAENERLQREALEFQAQYEALENECEDLSEQIGLVTSEREFYFKKLRGIEIMAQTISDLMEKKQIRDMTLEERERKRKDKNNKEPESPLPPDFDEETLSMLEPVNIIQTIMEIMYSTEDGFATPDQVDSGAAEEIEMDAEEEPNRMDIDVIPEGDDETF